MALFIEGMACPICGRPMEAKEQAITCFRSFVSNRADPLWQFNDGCFRTTCFRGHPLARRALARIAEYERSIQNWPPTCELCGQRISFRDPDDYFGLGHLTDATDDSLFRLNYSHYHRSCLSDWPELRSIYDCLTELDNSGRWQGPALASMLHELRPLLDEK